MTAETLDRRVAVAVPYAAEYPPLFTPGLQGGQVSFHEVGEEIKKPLRSLQIAEELVINDRPRIDFSSVCQ